jgi:SAM-dependent methyltransferase
MLRAWLSHPLTRGLDIDDVRTTEIRRRIVQQKRFLRRIYEDWYEEIRSAVPWGSGRVLEIGSGPGFLKEVMPDLITSDILPLSKVDAVLDACQIPFCQGSLRGIVMVDVFHHLPRPKAFLKEAARCVRRDGRVVMIEPWVTPWSRWIFQTFHHERFDTETSEFFEPGGPLSAGNGALPWIIFEKNKDRFESGIPEWRVKRITPMFPFRYLVSGGVSLRALMPGWSYGLWRGVEWILKPCAHRVAMFACVELLRR